MPGAPPAAVRPGRARQSSGTGPCEDCRKVLWVADTRSQYFGNIRFKFIEKPGVQGKGGCHMAKRSFGPLIAYPEVKVQVLDLVRVVGIIDPLSQGESIYRTSWCKLGTDDLCRVPPAAVRHERARQSSGTELCGDCRSVLRVAGTRGQYSGNIRFKFIEKPGVQD